MYNGSKMMSGGRWKLALVCAAGGLMLLAAVVELFLGVAAERKPLEEVTAPLSLEDAP